MAESKNIINVKNAEVNSDTTAEIVVQNKIDFEPKVSVIIPVYNVEKYLRECLDSVVNQTLKDIEIICVDDGSTDTSLKILKEYAKKDNRITVISQDNLYAGIARNAGLVVAKAPYISFIDSDDYLDKEMLKHMYEKSDLEKCDICICQFSVFDNKTKQIENIRGIDESNFKKLYIPTVKEKPIFQITNPAPFNKLYRHKFIRENRIYFQNLLSSNDVAFTSLALALSEKIAIIKERLYYYRTNIGSSLTDRKDDNLFLFYDALLDLRKRLKNNNVFERYYSSYLNFVASVSLYNLDKVRKKHILFKQLKEHILPELEINSNTLSLINEAFKNKLKYIIEDTQEPDLWYENMKNSRNDKKHKIITILGLKIKIKRKSKSKNSFIENIFSIKNKEKNNKWYKVITILGIKFKFKSNSLTQKKQLKDLSSNLLELQQSTTELIKKKEEDKKQIAKLETMINILQEKYVWLYEWQQNFYKDHPEKYPIRLTEAEKQAIKREIENSKLYLEFGSGGSTFLALDTNAKIVSVESDLDWINYLKSYKSINNAIVNNRLNFYYINIGATKAWGYPVDDTLKENYPNYSNEIFEQVDKNLIDLVFIDGRFRVACALNTILNCNKNTKIMMHDYVHREFYHIIEEFLEIIEVVDTLAIFKIKNEIDKNKILDLYEKYKFVKE